ncbi:hypothetical protein ACLKA7_015798 [Drosophila subpalustris]
MNSCSVLSSFSSTTASAISSSTSSTSSTTATRPFLILFFNILSLYNWTDRSSLFSSTWRIRRGKFPQETNPDMTVEVACASNGSSKLTRADPTLEDHPVVSLGRYFENIPLV